MLLIVKFFFACVILEKRLLHDIFRVHLVFADIKSGCVKILLIAFDQFLYWFSHVMSAPLVVLEVPSLIIQVNRAEGYKFF